jgi:hypothetical protein
VNRHDKPGPPDGALAREARQRGCSHRSADIPYRPTTDPGCMSAAEPTVIAPEGDLDIASVGDLRAALSDVAREGAGAVVVD